MSCALAAFDLGGAAADSGLRALRSRSGDEQLDVGALRLSGEADGPRQGAQRGRSGRGWADLHATRMSTATAFPIARCRGPIIRRRHTLPAAADTTRRRSTPSVRMNIKSVMERLARKFETARTHGARAGDRAEWQVEDRADRLWNHGFRVAREPRSAQEANTSSIPITCGSAPFRSRREVHEFIASHERIYVIEQNRDAQMLSLLKLDMPPEQTHQTAQCSALQWLADRCAHA